MSYKKILGLDLGVSSIGWALIKEENEKPTEIMGMGVRIIPLDTDENDEFTKGNSITKNQKRTQKRTMRKGYYRYVLRRTALTKELKKHGMFDDSLFSLPKLKLWELIAKAVNEKISLTELGRVLYHLNQKRGYKSSRNDENLNKKDTEYVSEIKNRYNLLKESGKTIGEKFYEELSKNPFYRIKQQVYPREAYIEEYDKIMKKQQEFYPDILTDDLVEHIRNDIIYYQRKLKSQKGLVSICEFEGFTVKNNLGKEIFAGPKVAHRSNPLFQVEKIWETINNITIENKYKEIFQISPEQKKLIFEHLDNNEKLTQKELFKLLGIKEKSGWYTNKQIVKGLQGNTTKMAIKKALSNKALEDKWLQFNIEIVPTNEKGHIIDKDSGEIIGEFDKKIINHNCVNQPLYLLWHTIYSISDIEECKNALIKKFGFDETIAENLAKIDFSKQGYGNKSVKAIRKILPYLMDGLKYNEAAEKAGYNHSDSITKSENDARKLLDKIPLLKKNALRQPVVEKIINQMIHIVNDIIDDKKGWITKEERDKGIFEIRIELARELKQSKEERNETFKYLNRREKENKEIEKALNELGIRATRKNIIKYRLFTEITNQDKKANAVCIYTGKTFSLTDALNGDNIDVEHIIPRSLVFDDSQSNKTLTFREINQDKGNRTAYDYIASKGVEELEKFKARVAKLYEDGKISKSKRDKLLMSANEIPKDFIQRQLRESQYISRKSREILTQVCKNVWVTGGGVTEYLRRLWGWDDILMNLQIKRIKEIITDPIQKGITEIIEWETEDGQKHQKEVIKNWSKRDDHRHHAIDALVIACTKQGYIQRINTLSAQATRDELYKEISERKAEFRESLSLLDKYFIAQRPFTTHQIEKIVSNIIVSFKAGKKVATYGKRFIKKNGKRVVVQEKLLVPRGPLSEESVYGKIKIIEKEKPLKYLFENPNLIFKPYIKDLVEKRLAEHNGDVKKALASLKKNPIYLPNKETPTPLEYATCFKEEYVIKYPIENITLKDLEYVIDEKLKNILKERLEQHNNNPKEAFKEPVYLDKNNTIQVKTVRLKTGLSAVEPIKYDQNGKPLGFVKPGNNHHIAIYQDKNGNKIPHLCTLWHAVERKKYKLPIIIDNTTIVWNNILQNNYPPEFIKKLPPDNLYLLISFQLNEIFYIHDNPYGNENKGNINTINPFHLFRLQKMSVINGQINLWFRQIFETKLNDTVSSAKCRKYYNIQSLNALEKLNPIKIKVNRLGEIEQIGIK